MGDGSDGIDGGGDGGGGGSDGRGGSRRATVLLPTGSGKTAVGLWVVESLLAVAPERAALVCALTLPLIDQTLAAYRRESCAVAEGRTRLLVVASKCASAACTTEPRTIARFLAEGQRADGEGSIVLSTYDSLKQVARAELLLSRLERMRRRRAAEPSFGVCVFDEAHCMAGRGRKFALGLDDARLRLPRRLFLTGTPRRYSAAAQRDGAAQDDSPAVVRSMDDAASFGRVAYRMSHQQGVDAGVVVGLRLLVYNASKEYAQHVARNPEFAVAAGAANVPRDEAEMVVALSAAMADHGLSNAFSFHATVAAAKGFCAALKALLPLLQEEPAEASCVWGAMPAAKRAAALASARAAPRSVVTNPHLLATGVDAPDVDLVLLASPRQSHVQILQMGGRATRVAEGKRHGHVLLPVRAAAGSDGGFALDDGSYETALSVLQAVPARRDWSARRCAFRARRAAAGVGSARLVCPSAALLRAMVT